MPKSTQGKIFEENKMEKKFHHRNYTTYQKFQEGKTFHIEAI